MLMNISTFYLWPAKRHNHPVWRKNDGPVFYGQRNMVKFGCQNFLLCFAILLYMVSQTKITHVTRCFETGSQVVLHFLCSRHSTNTLSKKKTAKKKDTISFCRCENIDHSAGFFWQPWLKNLPTHIPTTGRRACQNNIPALMYRGSPDKAKNGLFVDLQRSIRHPCL